MIGSLVNQAKTNLKIRNQLREPLNSDDRTIVKVAGVQMDVAFAQPARNLARMGDYVQQASREGAQLVVFPECALTGYCYDSFEEATPVAEPIPGPSVHTMTQLCQAHDCFVIYGLLEADGDRLFNALALVGPKGLLGSYRKIHLPGLGIDRFVTPGDRPFEVHDLGMIRVGLNICYDGSFPEASRVLALQGADLIALPTNWPPGAHCIADYSVSTRALENNVYYMAVNRIGEERGFQFIGKSQIADVNGKPLAAAMHTDEAILTAELDPRRARNKHIIRVPNKHEIHRFRDRRPEMYGDLVRPHCETTAPEAAAEPSKESPAGTSEL